MLPLAVSNLTFQLTIFCQPINLHAAPSIQLKPPFYHAVHNDLVRATDNGQVSPLVLLDLSAAFDTVDHEILVSVLSKRFSLAETVLYWCQSYLNDCTQTFSYADRTSSSFTVDCSVPQGSVLGPLEFEAYPEDIVDVLDKHDVKCHLYADDTQLYNSSQLKDTDMLRSRISHCIADVALWCASRRLQFNTEKTVFIWFGSLANLKKLRDQDCSLQVGSDTIQPSTVVRKLGVLFDSELSMKQMHVAKVAATCFYHLRRLRQIRRRVGAEVTTQLVLAFITSRLDYCNSVLAAVPHTLLEPLQRVQNAAVRLIFELGLREHVTSGLLQLHWLPVRWRIQYKLCAIMHSIHIAECPTYLKDIVQTVASSSSRSGLRSSTSNTLRTSPHGCALISESGRSHTLVRQPGIRYQLPFVPKLVKYNLKNCWKLTFQILFFPVDCVFILCSSFAVYIGYFYVRLVMRLCSFSNERNGNVLMYVCMYVCTYTLIIYSVYCRSYKDKHRLLQQHVSVLQL